MVQRRIFRLLKLTLNPLAEFDGVMGVPEWLLTIFGVSIASVISWGVAWAFSGPWAGVWTSVAAFALLLNLLTSRAAYQLLCEVEVKRDRAARAAEIGGLIDEFGAIWRDGDDIKFKIEHRWKDGNEQDVHVYGLQVTELLEQARPQYLAGFLNDGFPDGGIRPRAEWTDERNRAFRDMTVRLHRLKEEVLDKLIAEQDAHEDTNE